MIRVDGFPMDLAKREEYSFESEATEHPIERGADVTDHVRARPIEITLECVVSDSPLAAIANDPTRQSEDADVPLPSEEAYARLLAIRDARQPVTIETGLATFENMVLLSLSVPRDATTAGGLFFEATFRQVKIVENRRVTVRVAVPIAKGKANLGTKVGKFLGRKGLTWRKGRPPGSPTIVATETLRIDDYGVVKHGNGKPLTEAELVAWRLDSRRDVVQAEAEDRKAIGDFNNKRAEAFLKAQRDNPGKYIDPALFGF